MQASFKCNGCCDDCVRLLRVRRAHRENRTMDTWKAVAIKIITLEIARMVNRALALFIYQPVALIGRAPDSKPGGSKFKSLRVGSGRNIIVLIVFHD